MLIDKLSYWNKNPRKITTENLDKLKKSLEEDKEFLTKRKILVNKIGDKYIVYGGNQRLKGLKELGYKEIPNEWIDIDENLSEELMTKRAFKDNVEYGQYDYDIMSDNFDIDFLVGLDLPDDEIDLSMITNDDLDEEKENFVPEPQKEAKLVKVGDIFGLGAYIEKDGKRLDVVEFIE